MINWFKKYGSSIFWWTLNVILGLSIGYMLKYVAYSAGYNAGYRYGETKGWNMGLDSMIHVLHKQQSTDTTATKVMIIRPKLDTTTVIFTKK